jgi:hypothetical protein
VVRHNCSALSASLLASPAAHGGQGLRADRADVAGHSWPGGGVVRGAGPAGRLRGLAFRAVARPRAGPRGLIRTVASTARVPDAASRLVCCHLGGETASKKVGLVGWYRPGQETRGQLGSRGLSGSSPSNAQRRNRHVSTNGYSDGTTDICLLWSPAPRGIGQSQLLRFYVLGVVTVVALAVWGASLWRTAAEAGTPQKPQAAAVGPSTKNAELSRQARRYQLAGRGADPTSRELAANSRHALR